MTYKQAIMLADILKALAHPVRVLIVHALIDADRCVGDLNTLVELDQSNISRHLAVLKRVGIISDRREGMRVFYHLETPCILHALDCAVEVVKKDSARRATAMATT